MKQFFVLCLISTSLVAQTTRQTTDEAQVWTAYFNQTRLSDKWGLWGDFHFRTTHQFIGEPSKAIVRLGLMYYLNDDLKLTNGYAFINHFPEEGHANVSQPEHRIWHQLQLHTKYGKVRTMQWVRLEERFRRKIKNDNELAEGYRFDERIRYNFLLNVPLSKKGIAPKTVSAIFNDELMINLSKNNVYNVFDQNRLFVGIAYNFNTHSNLQLGYMSVYQQLASGSKFKNMNSIRVFFFQNLDFRKQATKH
jgi:hypothetical protein